MLIVVLPRAFPPRIAGRTALFGARAAVGFLKGWGWVPVGGGQDKAMFHSNRVNNAAHLQAASFKACRIWGYSATSHHEPATSYQVTSNKLFQSMRSQKGPSCSTGAEPISEKK